MKKTLICMITILLSMAGCDNREKQVNEVLYDLDALQGTWRLVKYIDHEKGGGDWSEYNDDIIYQKHITPTHFTWIKYDTKKEDLEGIGGGHYSFDGNTYTEDIQFFLPAGSSELGQAIPFDVSLKDGQWYHVGYAKIFEFDAEVGDVVVSDSLKIEEVWEKVENGPAEPSVMGTWHLGSYREPQDSTRSEYPPFVRYIKSITPTHFIWVKYNGEGDEVMGAGSGKYEFSNDVYTEHLEMIYPKNTYSTGTSASFTADIISDLWAHYGYVQKVSDNGAPDSVLVDEIWDK